MTCNTLLEVTIHYRVVTRKTILLLPPITFVAMQRGPSPPTGTDGPRDPQQRQDHQGPLLQLRAAPGEPQGEPIDGDIYRLSAVGRSRFTSPDLPTSVVMASTREPPTGPDASLLNISASSESTVHLPAPTKKQKATPALRAL